MVAGKSTPVTAERFGVVLEGRYGGPGQEDQPIDYFFIRVSHPKCPLKNSKFQMVVTITLNSQLLLHLLGIY